MGDCFFFSLALSYMGKQMDVFQVMGSFFMGTDEWALCMNT